VDRRDHHVRRIAATVIVQEFGDAPADDTHGEAPVRRNLLRPFAIPA
jgi:hypothetical protein